MTCEITGPRARPEHAECNVVERSADSASSVPTVTRWAPSAPRIKFCPQPGFQGGLVSANPKKQPNVALITYQEDIPLQVTHPLWLCSAATCLGELCCKGVQLVHRSHWGCQLFSWFAIFTVHKCTSGAWFLCMWGLGLCLLIRGGFHI